MTIRLRMLLWLTVTIFATVLALASEGSEWWQSATMYELYLRSFQDSNGDGVGDIRGIMKRAGYLKELGVDAVWLTPFFPSPMVDFGYDITDFMDVDPIFGNMDDFKSLVTAFKKNGIRVVVDFVPNHTSDQHLWFECSKNTSHPLHQDYRDFYVWASPNGTLDREPQPPNNWLSTFGGSAWTYSEDRKQFYLHQFTVQQPDLNYRNPAVVGNMTNVIQFWMDQGIDGFRIDAAPLLFENASLLSEPVVPGVKADDFFSLQHIYTLNQPETFDLLKHWANLVKMRNQQDCKERFIVLEVYAEMQMVMKYFGGRNLGLLFPFNFMMLDNLSPSYCKEVIDKWLAMLPDNGVMTWVSGNHDMPRMASRYGSEMVDAVNMMITIMPGLAVTYYGEEIGMDNTLLRPDEIRDPLALRGGKDRDPFRTPMQWDDSTNAGFTSNRAPWIPVNPNYWRLNVNKQKADDTSHLSVYKTMMGARQSLTLKLGGLEALTPDNFTLVIIRDLNSSYYVLAVNMGSEEQTYSPRSLLIGSSHLLDNSSSWCVLVGSGNSGYAKGTKFDYASETLTLRPKAAVVLVNWTPSSPTPSSSATSSHLSDDVLLLCILFLVITPYVL